MRILNKLTGETEFSRIDVEVVDQGPEEWPYVEITVSALDTNDNGDVDRSVGVTMDEARVIIAGLAAVVR